jgi:Bacteriophage P2-related tail formation protein
MSTLLRAAHLIDNCTPSISYDAQVQSACIAFDQQMFEIIDDTGQVVMIPSIMNIEDSNLIDILAWQFHVDFYDPTRDLEFRKKLVQMSITWHVTKGTVSLVEDVVNTYWPVGAVVEEWFDYMSPLPPGLSPTVPPAVPYPSINSPPIVAPPIPSWHDRYRFRITIDQNVITPADETAVLALINAYKPISRWLDTYPNGPIVRPRVSECNIGWAGAMLKFTVRQSEAPKYP